MSLASRPTAMDDVTFMDELELMWGRRWGAQSSIGELRTALFQRPRPARRQEDNEDPKFFVNFGSPGDVPDWEKRLLQYGEIRVALGACPRIRSWRRKPPRNNLLTAIWTLSWSN